jgi:hypothetical protein
MRTLTLCRDPWDPRYEVQDWLYGACASLPPGVSSVVYRAQHAHLPIEVSWTSHSAIPQPRRKTSGVEVLSVTPSGVVPAYAKVTIVVDNPLGECTKFVASVRGRRLREEPQPEVQGA